MIELSQLNGADWVIIVVLSVSTLLSLWRGFVREALSLLGWVAAFVVAHLFVDQLAIELAAVIANETAAMLRPMPFCSFQPWWCLPWWSNWRPVW